MLVIFYSLLVIFYSLFITFLSITVYSLLFICHLLNFKNLNISVFVFAPSAQLLYSTSLANELLYVTPLECHHAIILLEHVFNQIRTVFGVRFLERVLKLRVKTCEVNNTAGISLNVRPFHAKISSDLRSCIKLFYFEYSMDIGAGPAKLMHRANIPTNIYSPHRIPKRELLDFLTGVLMSSNFHRPPNNQTKFFEYVK